MNGLGYIPEFQPGTIITLPDMTQLPILEDIIASHVDPQMWWKDSWEGRENITDILRPPKFNGRIVDVNLEVMEQPYSRLQDHQQRGFKLYRGTGGRQRHGNINEEDYIGLSLLADAVSTGRGIIGQVQAELWYTPASIYVDKHGHEAKNRGNCGASVGRMVTKPKLEVEKFIELDQTAKRIGFEVLREQMKHPIKQPMHQ